MDNQKIVAVFGLSGVGKSTLIKNVLENRSDFVRVSGGNLINNYLSTQNRDQLRKLTKSKVLNNQEVLISNFIETKKTLKGKHIIFDGHCLIKNGEALTEIPTEVVKRISPNIIIFIDGTAEEVIKRRREDSLRPNREIETASQIDENRFLQKSICSKYSSELSIPLEIIYTSELDKFSEILNTNY